MAAYTEAAAAWVAAGVIPLPLGGVDGKRPLVSNPARFGRRAAMDIASRPQFADARGLGFWAGAHNGLTIVDVDSPADAELQYAVSTYGNSPVIVQTASGKAHLYYQHSGEPRRIRPDKRHDIDLLGEGGIVAAPPTERPAGGRYRFLRGGLGDLRSLPKIRAGAVAVLETSRRQDVQARRPHIGNHRSRATAEPVMRNVAMFRLALALASKADDNAALLDQVRKANAELPDPLPDDEIVNSVGMAWRYREEGRLMVRGIAESSLILPASLADYAMATGNLDVAGLMMVVRKYHSEPGKTFALSSAGMADANKING